MASESHSIKVRNRIRNLELDEAALVRVESGGRDLLRRSLAELRAHIAFEKLAIQIMQYDS
jgi:hypothetical protein